MKSLFKLDRLSRVIGRVSLTVILFTSILLIFNSPAFPDSSSNDLAGISG